MKKINRGLTAVLPDIHAPKHDEGALCLALDRIREERPERVVLLGDVVDFEGIARFTRKMKKRAAFALEVEAASVMIHELEAEFKRQSVIYICGNHESVSEDTLILCETGWKPARDITTKDSVASFDMATKTLDYSPPVAVSRYIAPEHAVVSSSKKHETVTQNHALIVDGQRQLVETLPDSIPGTRFTYCLPSQGVGVGLSNNYIRFLVWCFTDGCLYKSGSNNVRIQFKLNKQRKIDRLIEVLDKCGVEYTLRPCKKYGINKLTPWYIRIYGSDAVEMFDILGSEKRLPEWSKNFDREQTSVFFNELLVTDGSKHYNQNCLTTTNKHNADMIQLLAVLNGRHCTVDETKHGSGFLSGRVQYKLRIGLGDNLYQHVKIQRSSIAIPVVSITTVNDTLITRENGKVNFTGNSRLDKYAVRNCPELSDLPAMALREVLNVPRRWTMFDYNLNAVCIDGVNFIHGRRFAGNVCLANIKKYMGSVVQGHSHRASSQYLRLPNGETIGAVEAGCLCNLKPNYASDVNWSHAMAWAQDSLPYLELL